MTIEEKINLIDDVLNIRDVWERTGLLEGLHWSHQLKLSQFLEAGRKFLKELTSGIYDDIDEFHKFESTEDLAGLLLPAISRKYRKEFDYLKLEELIILLNTNSELYYNLKLKAENPNKDARPKYLFDVESAFLD